MHKGVGLESSGMQTAEAAERPGGALCVRVGWLLDGAGSPVVKDVTVIVEAGLVRAVEPWAEDARGSAEAPDLSSHTVLPLLMDSHVHLTMSGDGDPILRREQLQLDYEGARRIMERHLREHEDHGVAAVRDGGDYGGFTLRYRKELEEKAAKVVLRSPGRAWRASGRYGRLIGRATESGVSLGQGIRACTDPVDHVKIVNSGLNSLVEFGKATPPQFGLEELREAVNAAREKGLKTMVHANGPLPVKLALDAGCDSIEHGFFMGRDNLERMAENDAFWVPTAVTMKCYSEELPEDSEERETARRILDHQLEQIAWAREIGVRVAAGSDSGSLGVHHGRSLFQELELLIKAGWSIEEAVACAASNAARLLGLEGRLGRIAPGMPACFAAYLGPPTTAVSVPAWICRQGVFEPVEAPDEGGRRVS